MGTVIQVSLYEVAVLAFSLIAAMGAVGKWISNVILIQFEKRLADHFTSQEQSRAEATRHWDARFQRIEDEHRRSESELQRFKLKVAEEYWRREDAVREAVTLDAKMDALAGKIDNVILRLQTSAGKAL
jgi:hypothetical protein